MGVIKFFSSSSGDGIVNSRTPEDDVIRVESNPNPKNHKLLNMTYIGDYMIVKVHYPDSTNYEGVKILIYKDIKWNQLLTNNKNAVDPHFGENKDFISPIARFEPTDEGWDMAHKFCKMMML